MVELLDDIGDELSGEESVVRVVDFGEFEDGLLGELVEFGGISEKLGEGLLKLKGEVHDCCA